MRPEALERERAERREQATREAANRIGRRLRDVTLRSVRAGADPTPLIAAVEREIRATEQGFGK